jgi:crotonobetainyl-CoA:carnitine CoA-transferase CaiB-like acyl-CoA transferase
LADEQLAARGFWAQTTHPVAGRIRVPAMPFQLDGSNTPWVRTPAPTIGEHNQEVLGKLLNLGAEEIADMERTGLIGTRPAGL